MDVVLASVVLVVAAGLDVVDEVVLHHDVGAPLVVVEPPPAAPVLVVGIDVVDVVVAHRSAGRNAQRVHAAHVAHHPPADVVDVIELDLVVVGKALGIAPRPADGHPGIAEVGHVVVGDRVVGAVADPHAHRAAEQVAAGADDVVVDGDVAGLLLGFGAAVLPALADAHPAGAHLVDVAPRDAAVAAAAAEPDAVAAHAADLAALDGHVAGTVDRDRRGDADRGLAVAVSLGRQDVRGMAKRQPLERDVLDELPRRRVAGDLEEGRRQRRDHLGLGHVLARQRLVVERAVALEEPLAGRVQGGLEVLDVIALPGSPSHERPRGTAGRDHRAGDLADRRQPVDRDRPGVVSHQRHVREPLLGHGQQRLDVRTLGQEGPVGEIGLPAGQRIDARVHLADHVVVELVGRARPRGAPAVDVELLEIALALGHLGHLRGPGSVRALLPSGDPPPAGEDRPGPRGSLVDDRALGRAAVFGAQGERFPECIRPGGHDDADRLGQRPLRLQAPHGVPRPGQRSQRAVRPLRVGPLGPARPPVVAVRGEVERHRPGGDAMQEDKDSQEQTNHSRDPMATHGGTPPRQGSVGGMVLRNRQYG